MHAIPQAGAQHLREHPSDAAEEDAQGQGLALNAAPANPHGSDVCPERTEESRTLAPSCGPTTRASPSHSRSAARHWTHWAHTWLLPPHSVSSSFPRPLAVRALLAIGSLPLLPLSLSLPLGPPGPRPLPPLRRSLSAFSPFCLVPSPSLSALAACLQPTLTLALPSSTDGRRSEMDERPPVFLLHAMDMAQRDHYHHMVATSTR